MHTIGQVSIDAHKVDVGLLEASYVQSIPLDQRVLAVASLIRVGGIVVCELDLPAFLTEDDVSSESHSRRVILQAMAQTVALTAQVFALQRQVIDMQAQLLVDSIEDAGVLQIVEVPQFLGDLIFRTPAIVFIPRQWLSYPHFLGTLSNLIVSKNWKANTIDVFDLENKFDDELKNWQSYDSSRFIDSGDPVRNTLASALGMTDTLERLKETYFFGRNIGRAVGQEHSHQWLAMDLKLEHFIPTSSDHVSHVDHADDVMLLRKASAEECARSIAPLYQQMNYPLWHAFREGYWDARRRDALEVLLLFDGSVAAEILTATAVANARRARAGNDWKTALGWCDDAEDAIRAIPENNQSGGSLDLYRIKLVKGDIYLYSKQFEQALEVYDTACRDLASIEATGIPQGSLAIGALINSGIALTNLKRPEEARERLDRGITLAEALPADDPLRQAVRDVTSNLLHP